MVRFLFAGFVALFLFSQSATAQSCSGYPWTSLSNGGPADAGQVMNNFNCILSSPRFSGRVGVSATPPAWSAGFDSSIDLGTTGAIDTISSSVVLDLEDNLYNGSGGYTYKNNGPGQMFRMAGNDYQWFQAGFGTGGTAASLVRIMHLDSSGTLSITGRMGIASTPSSWSASFDSSIDFGGVGALDTVSSSFDLDLADNLYNGSGGYTYKTSGPASMFRMGGNDFQWYEAGSAPAGSIAALSMAMRLTSSGNLGVGTSTPGQKLDVAGTIRQSNCTTAGTLSTNSSGDIICTSDARLKNILGSYPAGLSAIMHLAPQRFTYKTTPSDPVETFVHAGFIAQNVKEVIPEAVATQRNGYYSLDTTAVLAAAVNAIKELESQNRLQAEEIRRLKYKQMASDRRIQAQLTDLRRTNGIQTARK